MSTVLGILGTLALLAVVFFAVKAVIWKIKKKEGCKALLKKSGICFVVSMALFFGADATMTPEERAAKELENQQRMERIAQKEAQEQAEKEAKEKAEAEAKAQQDAQAAAEKQETSAVNIDVTEKNKQDKAALEEYVTSTLAGKYKIKNLSTTTFPAEGHDVYAVDFEISKKCTADEAQAEARKIRGLLDAFPAPVDSVRIIFSSGLISYSPDKPEFVQIAGGQRTTFK